MPRYHVARDDSQIEIIWWEGPGLYASRCGEDNMIYTQKVSDEKNARAKGLGTPFTLKTRPKAYVPLRHT